MGYSYHKYFIVLILWLASLLLPSAVWAAQIRLAWDPNTESDLAGYKVYYGMGSGVYGSPINVGNVTTYTLTNLTLGQAYFIAVTAYNASNNESGYSNEVSGDATELGQTCTVATSPSGLQVVVDGATYTAPQTFSWNPGSSYTVSVSSPQSGGAGVQYVYSSWSDGGGQSHTITAPSSTTTYTANFTTQYSLTTSASPSGGGTASPSGTNWYNSGQAVSVSATANAGYSFSNWTGDLSGSTNPTSLAMSGPKSVTANFAAIPETVSTPTTPSGLTNGVIGTSYSYSTGGASSNLGHSVQYRFDWKGDGTDLSSWGSATRSKTWTIAGTYQVRARARCISHTSVVSSWSNALSVSISAAAVSCTVATSPSGLQVVVDGATYTASQTFSWAVGSSHTVSVSSPQSGGAGVQYVYSSWSDGGGQSHTITAPSSSTTYTANFTTQYSLTTSASPSGGGTISPSGTNWYNSGQAVSVSATANAGYSFSNWTGDLSGSTNPTSLAMNGPKSVTANFAAIPETVSTPTTPSGPTNGVTGTSYSYSTGGASSNLGHSVEYQFDWKGDGTDLSPWGSATRSEAWTVAGTYQVRARARCISDTSVVSSWSNALSVSISAAAVSCTVATSPSGRQVVVDGATYTASQTFSWAVGSSHTVSVSSPQSGGAGVQYVYSSWSDGGGQSHTITAPSSSTTYTANFTTQYSLTTSASPSGGGTISPSGTNWYNSGQAVSVSATANAGYSFSNWTGDLSGSTNPTSLAMNGPKSVTANFAAIPETVSTPTTPSGPTNGVTGTSYSYSTGGASSNLGHSVEYQFDWKGDGTDLSSWGSATRSETWTVAGTYQVRARARCISDTSVVSSWSNALSVSISAAAVSCTVATSPSGLQVVVDGATYTASQTFSWNPGSSHTVSVSSPQSGGAGVQYVYSSWSDGGGQSHTITAPSSSTTYTANFTTQYSLTTSASPSGGGTASPSGTNWYNSGQAVSVSATANAGYSFSNWTGDLSGSTNPTSLAMNGPKSVTANFAAIPETVSTPTTPSGPTNGVTGTSYSYSTGGASSNLGHSVEYQFDWKGDGTDLSPWGSATRSETWTVAGTYQVRARARCISDTSVVSSWSNALSVSISAAAVSCTVATSPSGLQVVVDGATYTAPQTFSWNPGSSHTVSVSSPQSGGAGVQYVYSSWSDGGGQSHTITAPSSSTTYTANFTTQYSLTTSASPSGGGTASPSGTNWYNSGQAVSVSATANAGYSFSNWTGDLSGSTNPTSLAMNGPKSVTANFAAIPETVSTPTTPSGPTNGVTGTSYSYSTGGASSNLGHSVEYQFDWKGDGTDLSSWGSVTRSEAWTVAGTYQVRARARCISDTSVVSSWSNALSVSISAAAVSCTVATSPSGLQVVVDGATYTASQTFSWAVGSSHTVSVSSPQSGGSGVQYVYSSWSDGGGQSHTITAPSSSTTYTANFTTQYSLTTSASPSGGGTISPSGTNWYNSGQAVSVSATANAGYSFSNWTGDLSGSTNPTSLTMNGPRSVTVNFTQNQSYTVSLKAGPNLVSFPVISGEILVTQLLSLISGEYEVVYGYEGCDGVDPWKMYDPALPSYVNDLQYVDATMGIWIEMIQDTELSVGGSFPSTLSTPLCVGWNLISYAGSQAKPVTEALSSISGKYEKVYCYKADDRTDPWKMYDTSVPSYVNDLTTMEPGLGYWIYIKENCTLVVNN